MVSSVYFINENICQNFHVCKNFHDVKEISYYVNNINNLCSCWVINFISMYSLELHMYMGGGLFAHFIHRLCFLLCTTDNGDALLLPQNCNIVSIPPNRPGFPGTVPGFDVNLGVLLNQSYVPERSHSTPLHQLSWQGRADAGTSRAFFRWKILSPTTGAVYFSLLYNWQHYASATQQDPHPLPSRRAEEGRGGSKQRREGGGVAALSHTIESPPVPPATCTDDVL